MPPFQQEFSLSWDHKNWLLTLERVRLLVELACGSNALPGLSGGRPQEPMPSSLFSPQFRMAVQFHLWWGVWVRSHARLLAVHRQGARSLPSMELTVPTITPRAHKYHTHVHPHHHHPFPTHIPHHTHRPTHAVHTHICFSFEDFICLHHQPNDAPNIFKLVCSPGTN